MASARPLAIACLCLKRDCTAAGGRSGTAVCSGASPSPPPSDIRGRRGSWRATDRIMAGRGCCVKDTGFLRARARCARILRQESRAFPEHSAGCGAECGAGGAARGKRAPPALALLVRPELFLASVRLAYSLNAASSFFFPPAAIRWRRHTGIYIPILFEACLPCSAPTARRAIAIPHFWHNALGRPPPLPLFASTRHDRILFLGNASGGVLPPPLPLFASTRRRAANLVHVERAAPGRRQVPAGPGAKPPSRLAAAAVLPGGRPPACCAEHAAAHAAGACRDRGAFRGNCGTGSPRVHPASTAAPSTTRGTAPSAASGFPSAPHAPSGPGASPGRAGRRTPGRPPRPSRPPGA